MSFDLDNVEGAPGDYTIDRQDHGPGEGDRQLPRRPSSLTPSSAPRCRWHSMAGGAGTANFDVESRDRTGCRWRGITTPRRQGGRHRFWRGRSIRTLAEGRKPDADVGHVLGPGYRAPAAFRCRRACRPRSMRRRSSKRSTRYPPPHGCSEQITSRAMPLLYVNDLAAARIWRWTPPVDNASRMRFERCWRGKARTLVRPVVGGRR